MASLPALVDRVRLELNDQPISFAITFSGDGNQTIFELGYKPVDNATMSVTVAGTPVPQPTGYTVDQTNGTITLAVAPPLNSAVYVTGSYYRYFIDSEIETFINTALEQHTHNRTDSFGSLITVGSIPVVEEYPIAILSSIEALWVLATDSAYDIDINAPDGVHIPRSERFRQLTQIIQARMEQYRQLCSALNIGLWRIEMGTLRRVSRTTNKLVPIYMAQEIDDSRRPERVYMQNDLYGRTPKPTTASIYDVVIYQGDNWEATFDFPFDLTGYTAKAQIRTYPNAPSLYATFNVEYTDVIAGKITLSLTPSETTYLPVRAFWDLQLTADGDPNWQHTYVKGQVFVDQQVTVD